MLTAIETPLYLLGGIADPITLQRIREAVVMLIALVLSIAVHEFGHAIMADKLGDGTPRSQGRVTLNPLAHADPIGTLVFPLVGMIAGGMMFGWGKPVIVNPVAFTRRLRMKVAHMLVAAAGPAMNVALALVVTVMYALLLKLHILNPASEVAGGVVKVIWLNWILFFFNLIPCPPLDGGTVLAGLLPDRHQNVIAFLNQYGILILLLLLVTPLLSYFLAPARWLTLACVALAHGVLF